MLSKIFESIKFFFEKDYLSFFIVLSPAYKKVKYRISGELKNTDIVLENTFWVGVWPGISESNINYIYDTFKTFLKTKSLI